MKLRAIAYCSVLLLPACGQAQTSDPLARPFRFDCAPSDLTTQGPKFEYTVKIRNGPMQVQNMAGAAIVNIRGIAGLPSSLNLKSGTFNFRRDENDAVFADLKVYEEISGARFELDMSFEFSVEHDGLGKPKPKIGSSKGWFSQTIGGRSQRYELTCADISERQF